MLDTFASDIVTMEGTVGESSSLLASMMCSTDSSFFGIEGAEEELVRETFRRRVHIYNTTIVRKSNPNVAIVSIENAILVNKCLAGRRHLKKKKD